MIYIYGNQKWNNLSAKKIASSGTWHTISAADRMIFAGKSYPIGRVNIGDGIGLTHLATAYPDADIIFYVSESGSGNRDGSSWSNAAAAGDLVELVLRSSSGTAIFIAEGEYSSSVSLQIPAGVSLYGGFNRNDPSWESRNAFEHQSVLLCAVKGPTFVDGLVLFGENAEISSAVNTVFLNGYVDCQSAAENCFLKNSEVVFGGKDFSIQGCHFYKSKVRALVTGRSGSQDSSIKDSLFDGCRFEGVDNYRLDCIVSVEDSIFTNCEILGLWRNHGSSDFGLKVHLDYDDGCLFVNCTFPDGCWNGGGSAGFSVNAKYYNCKGLRAWSFYNSLVVNCDCSYSSYGFYLLSSTFVNSTEVPAAAGKIAITGEFNGLYNVPWITPGSAASEVNDFLTLGCDNSLWKFRNTGFAPAVGVQDLGNCPNPWLDPNGYRQYIAMFGDWHIESDSLLVGRSQYQSGEVDVILVPLKEKMQYDLDGKIRPQQQSLGCYEP